MASPNPVPPKRRVVDGSACTNGWKMRRCWSGSMPIPVSRTEKRSSTIPVQLLLDAHRQLDLALRGELDRVADQVEQDLT